MSRPNNGVHFIGRVTRAIDIRTTKNDKKLGRFTIAVDGPYVKDREKTTDFFNCVAFGFTADFIEKYFPKGSIIAIDGTLHSGSYDKNGTKVYFTDVNVDAVSFLPKEKNAPVEPLEPYQSTGAVDDTTEDLPF